MSLKEKLAEDLAAAIRARDEVSKRTLRMLKSELGKRELALGRAPTEEEELAVLLGAVKSRRDSVASYEEAGRLELAEDERAEIAVVERYLPPAMSEEEARDAIAKLAAELGLSEKREMGRLMGAVMEAHRGRIDGKLASRIARELLS